MLRWVLPLALLGSGLTVVVLVVTRRALAAPLASPRPPPAERGGPAARAERGGPAAGPPAEAPSAWAAADDAPGAPARAAPQQLGREAAARPCFNGPNCYEAHFENQAVSGALPGKRAGMRAALHNSSGVVLVYGGMGPSGSLSDVHAYRVVERSWVHCATTGAAPSGRVAPSLALWEGGSQLLVFGGMDDLGFPEELHSLSFEGSDVHSGESLVGHWSVVEVGSTRPSGRYGHTAVFDEASSTMLVFGGSDDHYQALKELWRYDAAAQAWSLLLPSGAAPASRYYHAAAWGPAQEKMFVSGGITGGADLPTEVLGDLWVYDARENSWRELVSSSAGVAAPARWSHSMVFMDTVQESLMVFGGMETVQAAQSTSSLYGLTLATSAWEELSWTGGMTQLDEHVAVWYPGLYNTTAHHHWDDHDCMVTFGGWEDKLSLSERVTHMWFRPI